jgi:phage tail sheath protein FI
MPEQFLHGVQVVEITDGPRPIRTVNSAIIGLVGTAPDAEAAVPASATIGTGSSALTFVAQTPGIAGNSISVRLKNPGTNSAALAVTVDDTAITVSLATNSSGVITSTAAQVKTAIEASTAANALVEVSGADDGDGVPGGSSIGTGVVVPSATVRLTGGLDESFPINTPYRVAASRTEAARAGATGTLPAALDDILDQVGAVIVCIRAEVGGDDAATQANVIAAIDKLLDAESVLGLTPRILIAPEFSQNKEVADALISVANKLRAFAFADGPNTTDADAINYATQFGSDRLAIIDPWLVKSGVDHAPSASWAGATAKSDYDRGFWWSPSNVEILGFTGTARAIGFRLGDPTSPANLLNEANITTVIKQNGNRIWGNRTTSADPKFAFISVRRTADLINDSILRAHLWAVDRNISRTYLEDVTESVNGYLKTLTNLGAILGGRCWPDPDLNSPANISQGKVYFNFEFTPPYPAENITFRSILVNDYITEILN